MREISEKELEKRIKWFIQLRWLAILGVTAVISGAKYILDINLPVIPLYAGVLVLFICNGAYSLYGNKLKLQIHDRLWFKKVDIFANFQVMADLLILTYFVHYSGSLENPFVFYFVFHMVIASILLSNRAAFLHATLVAVLLGFTVLGEYTGFLRHYHLDGFLSGELFYNKIYLIGSYIVLSSTIYITIFMTTSIVNRLREGEHALAEQSRLKSRYVLTVAHELRSSISTIQSCLKVVLDGITGPVSEKSREFVGRANNRSISMLSFVNDLLDLSGIRAEKILRRSAVSFGDIVERAVERVLPGIKEKNLVFQLKNDLKTEAVFVNEEEVERAVINLVENALRYTPSGGELKVHLENKNGYIETEISDTGIGVAEEDIGHLFEDFYRAKNARAVKKDGTGLGLPIVKQIIEAHSGKIWVESRLGKGSKFAFSIPEYRKTA